MSERGKARNIGLKVDTTEKECNLVGRPKHFQCREWRDRRRTGDYKNPGLNGNIDEIVQRG